MAYPVHDVLYEINYGKFFERLYATGDAGALGIEHGRSVDGIAGAIRALDAVRKLDPDSRNYPYTGTK
ncbi:MAG: hypothetical protein AAGJ38_06150 [Planctomycetota bacterium]